MRGLEGVVGAGVGAEAVLVTGLTRRKFLGAAIATGLLANRALGTTRQFKAIAFDALVIFDPSSLGLEAEMQFPGQGKELTALWQNRLFEYQWLRAAGERYTDFQKVAEEALLFAANSRKLDLSPERRNALLATLLQLNAYSEVKASLRLLKAAGFRLAFLSNMTSAMLEAGIKNSGLQGLFDETLSTDRVHTYKPDPKAYQLAVDVLHLKRDKILFVPSAGWDLSGARWFGYPTFWVNRPGASPEELNAGPEASGKDLSDLCRYLGVILSSP